MQVTFNTNRLRLELELAVRVLEKKLTMPVLQYAHVDIKDNVCHLTMTDLAITLFSQFECDSNEDHVFLFDIEKALQIVKTAKSETLTFDISEKAIQVATENAKYKLPVHRPEDYPQMRLSQELDQTCVLPAKVLKSMLTLVLPAVNAKAINPALQSIHWTIKNQQYWGIGTNEHCLSFLKEPVKTQSEFSFLVPYRSNQVLKYILGKCDDNTAITLRYKKDTTDTHKPFLLEVDGRTIRIDTYVGSYPNVFGMIERLATLSRPAYVCDTETLRAAVRRVNDILPSDAQHIKLAFTPSTLMILGAQAGTEVETQCPIINSSGDTSQHKVIGVNPEYLLAFLEHWPASTLTLSIGESSQPIVMTAPETQANVWIMPVRLPEEALTYTATAN